MIILTVQRMLFRISDLSNLSKATEVADKRLDKNLADNSYSIIICLVNH